MRIFLHQENLIETTPAIDHVTKEPRTDLTVTFSIYDQEGVLVPDSTITLVHTSGGVYRGTLPEIGLLTGNYLVELSVTFGSTRIYYFKGPAKVIVRSKFDI